MGYLIDYAQPELNRPNCIDNLGFSEKERKVFESNLLAVLKIVEDQSHSGFSFNRIYRQFLYGMDPDNTNKSDLDDLESDAMELLTAVKELGYDQSALTHFMEILTRLANFKPLSPLTGEESEWNGEKYSEKLDKERPEIEQTRQNLRYSSVFQNLKTKEVYDINATKVLDKRTGNIYSADEWKTIEFPYYPSTQPTIVETYIA